MAGESLCCLILHESVEPARHLLSFEHPMSDKAIFEAAMQEVSRDLTALEERLEARTRALNNEIRSYPTPIARCDVQLTELLERRASVVGQWQVVHDLVSERTECSFGDWTRRLDRFLMEPDTATEDDVEAVLRYRLRAALSALCGRTKSD